ncbi:MAG: hypothetical protein H3C62_10750 [Gemmatimonadaceae bacterium]|nr:hypothetical protein [Gemmatimonadaceae bacterium]
MLRDAKIRALQEQLPTADYCGTFDVAYPVYDCELEVRMLALERLSAIEEYVLRSVTLGARTTSAIDLLLGLGLPATRRAVAELLGSDLLEDDQTAAGTPRYSVSDAGREALQQLAVKRMVVVTVPCLIDAISGSIAVRGRAPRLMGSDRVTSNGALVLPAQHDGPTVDAFDPDEMRKLLKKLAKMDADRWPPGEYVDLQKLVRAQKRFRRLDVAVFAEPSGEWVVRAFERQLRQKDSEANLAERLRHDPTLLPLERNQRSDDLEEFSIVPAEMREAAIQNADLLLELEEQLAEVEVAVEAAKATPANGEPTTRDRLATLESQHASLQGQYADLQARAEQGTVVVPTGEHRELLRRAFAHAREQVIIISPWVTREAVNDELIGWLLDAIRRGVRVRIGWGFSDATRDQPKEKASEEMITYLEQKVRAESSQSGESRGSLQAVRLGNSHEKVLIADTHFAVVTSFNWLSFLGDPRRKHRREKGLRIAVPATVKQLRTEFESVLDAAATQPAGVPVSGRSQAAAPLRRRRPPQ